MRTQKELSSREFQDDMAELKTLLDKEGIKYSFDRHEGAYQLEDVMEVL